MNQNEKNPLAEFLGNAKALSELASSADAQALASLLVKAHDPGGLEQMAQHAMNGDVDSLRSLMKSVTQDPQGAELLQRLSERFRTE